MIYTLHITPKPTPRPRFSKFGGAYNTSEYTSYKSNLQTLIKAAGVRHDDYVGIHACFYFPYPKSTPKKKLIDSEYHRKKCDLDNCIKGLQDAMEQAGVLTNDGQIAVTTLEKRYTTQPVGRIEFELFTLSTL